MSTGHMVLCITPRSAEASDVAIPMDPLHAKRLVVEDCPEYRWWLVLEASWTLSGPLLICVALSGLLWLPFRRLKGDSRGKV